MRVFWLEAQPWDRAGDTAVTVRACNVALSTITLINGAPPFLEVLADGPTTSTVVFDGTFTGRVSTTFGTIPLQAGQGDIDYWAALAWSDRPVKIWTAIVNDASAVPAWGALELIWDGVAESFKPGKSQAVITLRVKRPSGKLASGTYAGTGGVEGRVEITGAVKPYAAGVLLNRPAKLLDSGLGLYQVHGYGAVQALSTLREGYNTLDQTRVTQASTAALLAATVPATEIHTYAAAGLFRIGFAPISDITADFSGDSSGGFSARPGALIKRALLQVGWPLGSIDTASLDVIDTALPYDAWIYDETGTDISDIMDQFCRDIGGYWDVTELGVFYAGLVTRQTPVMTIGPSGQLRDYDLYDIDQLATQAPFYRNRVGYDFNPRTFTQAELGVAVAATTADWSAVVDDGGKPADGATAGDNLVINALLIGDTAPWTVDAGISRIAGLSTDPASYFQFAPGAAHEAKANGGSKIALNGAAKLFWSHYSYQVGGTSGTFSLIFDWFLADGTPASTASTTVSVLPATNNVWTPQSFQTAPPAGAVFFSARYRSNTTGTGGGYAGIVNAANLRIATTQQAADVTADAQVVVTVPSVQAYDADYLGNIIGSLTPFSVRVTRGGVSIKGDNAVSYAATIDGSLTGSIDTTNGSSTKGDFTPATFTGNYATVDVVVTVNGLAQPGQRVTFQKSLANPPAPGGSGSKTATDTVLNAISSTSDAVLSDVLTVTLASGESLYGTASLDYECSGTTSTTRSATLRWQYSPTGAGTWTNFASGITGSNARSGYFTGGEWVDPALGHIDVTQTIGSLPPGTYDVRLIGVVSATGRTLSFFGTAVIQAKV